MEYDAGPSMHVLIFDFLYHPFYVTIDEWLVFKFMQTTLLPEFGGSRDKFALMLKKPEGGRQKGSAEYEAFKRDIKLKIYGDANTKSETAYNTIRVFTDPDLLSDSGEEMIRNWIKILTDVSFFNFFGMSSQKKKLEKLQSEGKLKEMVRLFFVDAAFRYYKIH